MSTRIEPYELVCIVTGERWTPPYMETGSYHADGDVTAYTQSGLEKDGTLSVYSFHTRRLVAGDDGLVHGRPPSYIDGGWATPYARHVPEREAKATRIRLEIAAMRDQLHRKEAQLMALYGPKPA